MIWLISDGQISDNRPLIFPQFFSLPSYSIARSISLPSPSNPAKHHPSMVSNQIKRSGCFIAVAYLVCFSSFTSAISEFHSLTASSSDEDNNNKKVELALYYESLCPYSANFIVNYLAKIFSNGIIDIVNLNLVPWGNAKIGNNGTFNCQHGPDECLMNTVEACAINVWPEVSKHFPIINCIENYVSEGGYKYLWKSCFETLDLDLKPVTECCSNGQGNKLELSYANETSSLEPPHKYVPWVVVDGQPLYERYEEFITFVCEAYKGTSPPSVCKEEGSLLLREVVDRVGRVSYADDDDEIRNSSFLKRIQRVGKSLVNWMLSAVPVNMNEEDGFGVI